MQLDRVAHAAWLLAAHLLVGGCGSSSRVDSPDAGGADGGAVDVDGGGLGLGEVCTTDAQCSTGQCALIGFDFVGPTVCTAPCDGGVLCPEDGECLLMNTFPHCLAHCSTDESCPGALTCTDVGTGGGLVMGCIALSFDCDPKTVICRSIAPQCGSGTVAAVDGGCWTGACVDYDQCLPIPCDPASPNQCPPVLVCFANTRTCGFPL